MFIDRARIKVTAGAGGKGCCSFRREKYIPHGGPDGGDGGDGGDVYFVATKNLSSLLDLRYHSHWKGRRGVHGRGSDQHGKRGEESHIRVPIGTVLCDFETGEVQCDLAEEGQRFLAASGGRGGKGNARFATSTNRAPSFSELGEPGEEAEFQLELKLIADVGIVGLPNAGKSTLLSRISAAHPKIANYPFTTLSPNLGVVDMGQYRTITVADIPGLIEGAAQGKGLGHDFLRHIERTKVLLFFIDAGDEEPLETLKILEGELQQHSPVFETRPRVLAFNKADIPENQASYDEIAQTLEDTHIVSAVTGQGVPELLEALWKAIERARAIEAGLVVETPPEVEYTYAAPYTVEERDGGFRVEGKKVVRAVRMTDFDNEEALDHLQGQLKRMGLMGALKRMGAEEGQTIFIGDFELEYHE